MLETLMRRWLAAMTVAAAVVVAIQLVPFGRDYTAGRGQLAGDLVSTGGVADDEETGIPASLSIEHRELHATLEAITKLPGTTGMAALRVAELMSGHFRSEEEFAMPPLALLRPLAEDRWVPGSAPAVIAMSDRLKADWPKMLHEHQEIREALAVLAGEARAERRPDVLQFVEKLKLHAQQEEEILYPAAILVGEYLKSKGHT
jgi:hypothetical protein